MEQILEGFLLVAAISVALNVIFKKFQIPTIIGYIVTGTLISEFFNLKSNDEISHIAEFGIAFLMFTIGLEFSFKHLMSMKKEVFLNGGLQVCLSGFVMGVMLYYALHLNDETALIAGLAFALSSTAIVLKTLNDNGDVSKIYGRKALGILLFQDIAVIPILLMIDMFSSQDASINELLLKTFTSAAILIVVLFLLGKYVINWIFYKVVQTNSQEVFIATILFLVVGASTLAHFFGFSYSLGAFLAGMMMAETQYKHQIEVDLIPFRDLLLGLFFITVGMQINFVVVLSNIWLVLGLVFSIMVVKAIVVFAVLNIYLKRRVAAKTALSVCQIGEFALAVFGLMTTRNLLDVQTAQIFIAASVISMFVTPFILKKLDALADLVEREVVVESNETLKPQKLKNHIVVFGYDRLGQEVVLRLKETKLLYIVLDNDISLVELGRSRGENVFLGNVLQSNTLENACLDDAAAVIITVNNEQRVELIAQKIKDYGANIQTIIKANGEGNKEIFGELGANFHLISEERVMAKTLVHEALQCKIDHDVRA
ncbi:potassium transporter [Campylobacter concisus]|uniref:cation:proton antiporter n=1 Tax=Campylobacter concisus TaxID=199 RepID=UPI001883CBA4|nr:cation:proton antiporter [Campylobacter concisus]MBE9852425.1 potassium transporter [Campylobacter concisus]